MNLLKTIPFATILILFLNCGAEKSVNFQINTDGNQFKHNQSIAVSISNDENKNIKDVVYSIDGKTLAVTDGKIKLDFIKLGEKTLKAQVSYDKTTSLVEKSITVLAEKAPELYTYEIINEYPHDDKAYTQGLEFHNDTLYEGTGQNGRSFLRKYDYKTGEVYNQIDLEPSIFGEGITILNEKIYQLTWRSGMGYIYDLNSFTKIDNFQYGQSKEGWGLTNDGLNIYKSDGTEKIWLLNPETLKEKGYIQTATNTSLKKSANELEYVNEKIYANVYQFSSIMIIDAKSGAIEGVVNMNGLSKKIAKTPNWDEKNNVLNGIAYHPTRKTFFVTGKNWNKLFEIKIMKK